MILKLIAEKPSISRTELSQKLSLTDAQIKTAFKYLRYTNQINRDGSSRNGKWIIIK